jgi:tRNA A-37 threonylcarbamoyl transferase component Bud32
MSRRLPRRLQAFLDLPESERILGGFHLKRELGAGSFAPVWLADQVVDRTTLQQMAIKLFAIDPRLDDDARQDILDEAAQLCRVNHINVVRFYSLHMDEARGVAGLAMEYVKGESLQAQLHVKGRLTPPEAVNVGIAVASALVAVHAAGIIHGDIWTANVLEDRAQRGSPAAYKLIDFGISVPVAGPLSIRPESQPQPSLIARGKRGFVDPSVWRDMSPLTRESDLYALGALLFMCLSGNFPAAASGTLDQDVLVGTKSPLLLSEICADVPAALADLMAELLDPTPSKRPRSAEFVVAALEQLRGNFPKRTTLLPLLGDGPFRGPARFEPTDRDVFFGRQADVAAAIDRLQTRGLLALVGPSGSGKSSLARAGILPALEEQAIGRPRPWYLVIVSPGADPRRTLTTALRPIGLNEWLDAEQAAAGLDDWLTANQRGLVLLVDQLEELATLVHEGDALTASRTFTMDLLARLGERPRPNLRVIVTAQLDLLGPVLKHRRLADVLKRGRTPVAPLVSAEWTLVIDEALASYGYTFEDANLRATLMTELAGSGSTMPLVQVALAQLWRERDTEKKLFTWAAWKKVGGLAGALDQHAEAALYPDGRALVDEGKLKRLLLALTTPSGARAPRRLAELTGDDPDLARAVRLLADARLAVLEVTPEGTRVTLSHEALLGHWQRLAHWVKEERPGRLHIEALERDAVLWVETKDEELLFRQRRILLVAEALRRSGQELQEPAREFYSVSRAAARGSSPSTASGAPFAPGRETHCTSPALLEASRKECGFSINLDYTRPPNPPERVLRCAPMTRATKLLSDGPFHADQIQAGSRYELSDGHPLLCMPTGGRGSRANLVGASALETDPAVDSAGVDTGFSPQPKMLRAPDVAVGNIPNEPGWVKGVPPLAVEYADTGQDEGELRDRIDDLLTRGTRFVWVVRLVGPRRVEVHEPGGKMRLVTPGQELTAPGVLQNPVPIEALYDRDAAHEATLRNLLQRRGFASLEAVKEAGKLEGKLEGELEGKLGEARSALRRLLARRGLAITAEQEARIGACADLAVLHGWHDEAVVAASAEEALR